MLVHPYPDVELVDMGASTATLVGERVVYSEAVGLAPNANEKRTFHPTKRSRTLPEANVVRSR